MTDDYDPQADGIGSYHAAVAAMKERTKTRPYRPANGTEGDIFDDNWCSRCQRDAAWRDGRADGCDILTRTFVYNVGDPEYPTEWVEDDVPYTEDTRPRCTAFLLEGDTSTYVEDERQGELSV